MASADAYTEVVIFLDRSGSMSSVKDDHEGGIKHFLAEQKDQPGKCLFTLIQFDGQEPCKVLYDGFPIGDALDVKLEPRGSTPLLDAIGLGTTHVMSRLHTATPQPDRVVAMIVTDGYENASKEWTKARVAKRIAELEAKGWKFLYLGANVDAFTEAAALGISMATSSGYQATPQSVARAYALTSGKLSALRNVDQEVKTSGGLLDRATLGVLNYTDEDRKTINQGEKCKS